MKKQSGFTLIELMIVVAIVAILAAVALPAYQSYTLKAKATNLVAAVTSAKTAAEVYASTNGSLSGFTFTESVPTGISVAIGTSGANTTITATPTGTTFAPLTTSNFYTLSAPTSSAQLSWTCTSDPNVCK
ncbi:TPA: pilin [Aeromonas veronii]|nr:prepilin-type N-terminal cleavage/methylation domain-containing protein [Aeromonas veronii]